ncbi:MAG: alpha/beta fold hydrolase [Acidobacteriales bacterium]|nr:alpha/beta fold hydrolase [Terriglobales bacterium]
MRTLIRLGLLLVFALPVFAQDPVVADPRHFRVEFEDQTVRVLRFTLAPGESAPMHEQLPRITVIVRGGRTRVTEADGSVREQDNAAGEVRHTGYSQHALSNVGSTIFEAVSTEFKQPGFAYASPPKPTAPTTTVKTETPAAPPPVMAESRAKPTPQPELPAPPPPEPTLNLEIAPIVSAPIPGMKKIAVNGTELAYVERGHGDAIVLVHGEIGDLRSWSRQVNALSERYHVIAISRRCHFPNRCTGKEDDYTYEQHADDIAALISALNLGRAHVVGHSYGAGVAFLLATRHPEAVRSVVLMEPQFDSLLPEPYSTGSRYSRREILGIARKAILKRHDVDSALRTYVDWARSFGGWDEMPSAQKERLRENGNSLAAYSAHPDPPDLKCEEGSKINLPVLIARGELSTPNDIAISERLIGCIPGAERLVVPRGNHNMQTVNPAFFNEKVMDFVSRHK